VLCNHTPTLCWRRQINLSTRPEKSVGSDDIWRMAEDALRAAIEDKVQCGSWCIFISNANTSALQHLVCPEPDAACCAAAAARIAHLPSLTGSELRCRAGRMWWTRAAAHSTAPRSTSRCAHPRASVGLWHGWL
jgi:hypothetical protein